MKKLICVCLCLVLLLGLAIPVLAADMEVVFTGDSQFTAGSTVTVDVQKTRQSIMDDPSVDSGMYNAALEGNLSICWYKDNSIYMTGKSVTLGSSDVGSTFYCAITLYSDAYMTQECGRLESAPFTVTGGSSKFPEITTTSLPNAAVGEYYYQKLSCTDPDVTYSLFRSSLPDGLTLTQHGEIEGTPTKEGFWYVVVMATPEGGADYATTAEYEFYVVEAGPAYTIEIVELPTKLVYTAGEKLDMTGLRVRIYTPDGYIDSKDGDKLTYSQRELVTLGEQKIKLSYEDAMEIFIVTVVAAPEEPTEEPTGEPTEEPTGESGEAPGEVPSEDVTDVPGGEAKDPDAPEAPNGNGVTTIGPDTAPGTGNTSGNNWVLWIVIAVLALAVIAAAVVIILLVSKNKKR